MRFPHRLGVALLVLCAAASVLAADSSLPVATANDNRTPAGQLANGVLHLHLELLQARWFPEDERGASFDVYTFAEAGHPPQTPGPLIRVPQGTQIHLTIRNSLPLAAKIFGLHRHPGDPKDALTIAPGETRDVQFLAGDPGAYLYWATTANHSLEDRDEVETLLSGAFIIDPPDAKPDDRVFVIGLWTKGQDEIPSINGKSWPFTEHLTYTTGETIHWLVINPTASDHAMHLHGFFFTVNAVGDGERFDYFSSDQRPLAVTEHIDPGHVFDMTWTPNRVGNWLFHCHMIVHMSPPVPLHRPQAPPVANMPMYDSSLEMGGLVLGITILPGSPATEAAASAPTAPPHKLQLVISDNPEKIPLYKLEVIDPLAPPPIAPKKRKPSLLGPPIILFRGQPAEIEVKNQSSRPTSIHWHGMELQSYYDGVAGWTGSGQHLSPPVAPGTSFIARMTPPRAGTFIYHTHWHDPTQLVNGLYGPLIVLEPGQKYDSEHDNTFVFGLAKFPALGPMLLINGTPEPFPIQLPSGVPLRLRFINITDNLSTLRVRLIANDVPLQWKVIAKDGADLPPAQLKTSVADMPVTVGETYGVEFEAAHPGNADLQTWLPDFPVRVTQPLVFVAPKSPTPPK